MGLGFGVQTKRWGRSLVLILALGSVLSFAVGVSALGAGEARIFCPLTNGAGSGCAPLPPLLMRLDGAVTPRILPKHELQPVALELRGKVAASDGTHLSALREMTIDFDQDIALDLTGVPVCRAGGRDIRRSAEEVEKICRDAIVGGGTADFEIAFPEQPPIVRSSRLTAYTGGRIRGIETLFVVAEVDVPAPTLIVARVELRPLPRGQYGWRAVATLPVVAGGSGSLLDFKLRLQRRFNRPGTRRSLVTARCPDGSFNFSFPKLLFRNEAHTPGVAPTTVMRGDSTTPCSAAD